MATVTWVVLKHHKKVDGTFNPKIRITHNRTTAYIATQIFTPLVRFKKGEASGILTDSDILDSLNDKVKDIRKILNKFEYIIEDCENAKTVLSFIDKKMNQDKDIDFLAFADSCIAELKNNGSKSVKICLVSNLRKFVDTLPIVKLTSAFLKRFERWLKTERKISDSSLLVYMQAFQTIYNKALMHYNDYEIGDIVIVGDPFKSYKFETRPTEVKKAVSVEVIQRIFNYKPGGRKNKHTGFARDMFLLSFCLAGMNAADILACTKYSEGRIDYSRQKTRDKKKSKAFISVPVVSEIQDVFLKYRDVGGERVFNLYKTYESIQYIRVSLSRGMKILCKEIGIEPITFYAARHSFATIARNDCNVSMDDIALCLTHASGYNITDTYIKPDFSRVDKVIRKVVDYVFKEKQE